MQVDELFFQELGLGDVSAERKAELTQQLNELAEQQLSLILAERLTDEQLEHFNELADAEGDNVALAYLQDILTDYDQLVIEQTQQVKQAFINDMNMLLESEKKTPKT